MAKGDDEHIFLQWTKEQKEQRHQTDTDTDTDNLEVSQLNDDGRQRLQKKKIAEVQAAQGSEPTVNGNGKPGKRGGAGDDEACCLPMYWIKQTDPRGVGRGR